MADAMTTTPTKLERLCEFLESKRDDAPAVYLPWNSDSVGGGDALVSEIAENLPYELKGPAEGVELEEVADCIREMDSPDIDSWAPYYSQRSLIVGQLGSREKSQCEEWLEDIYSKPFDGCETLEDVEARISWAALNLAFYEVREWIIDEVLPEFFESEDEAAEVTA